MDDLRNFNMALHTHTHTHTQTIICQGRRNISPLPPNNLSITLANFQLLKAKYLTILMKILTNNKLVVPLTQSYLWALEYVCRVGRVGNGAGGNSVINYNICGPFQDKDNEFLGAALAAPKV